MQKQPGFRMRFPCGIDNPIGPELSFDTCDVLRCIARFRPKPEHQGNPADLLWRRRSRAPGRTDANYGTL